MSQHSSFGAAAAFAFRAASAAGVRDTLCSQLLSLTFATLPLHLQQSQEFFTVEQCVKLLQKIQDRVLIIV